MKRRSAIKTLAGLPAAALLKAQQPPVPPRPSAAAVETIPIIESAVPDSAAATIPSFFSEEQFGSLRRLGEVICPAAGDAPGAVDAGAPEFLDFLISQSAAERQNKYREGLDELSRQSKERFRVPFTEASETQIDALLLPLRKPWTEKADSFTAFLLMAREDMLQATQNSQEWIAAISKRVRSAGGVGYYWFPIE